MPSPALLIITESHALADDLNARLAFLKYPAASVHENGPSALERISQSPPDFILIDTALRNESGGFELARQIHLQWRLPLAFLVDALDRRTARLAQLAEPCGFVFKPVDNVELNFLIQCALAKHRERAPLRTLRIRLEKFDHCLLNLGTDHGANINRLTALCGELLEASCALYNRLKDGKILALGHWRTPPGFIEPNSAEGQICYDVIRNHQDAPVFITDLAKTGYAQSDPNVRACNLKTYLGRAVKCEGRAVGALCVLYPTDYQPSEDDQRILGLIASAIGNEDLRMQTGARYFQSQQVMRLVIDNIPQRVFWKDRDLLFLGCNQPFAEDAGFEHPDGLIGKTDFDLAWRDLAEAYQADDHWVIEHNAARYNYEEQQLQANGRRLWVKTSKAPLRDASGQVIGVLGTYEDITERRRAELALRTSEERYRQIVETAEEGIWLVDCDWKTTFVNAKLCQLLGWEPGEIQRRHFFDFIDKGEFPPRLDKGVVRERGDVISREVKFVRRDGQEFWALVSVSRMTNESGQFIGALIMATDITERKHLEEKLRHAQKMEAMGQLAGGVAHDFNNILTSFIMNIYLLKKDVSLAGNSRDLLTDIDSDAKRAANLTRQLLLFSRRQTMQFKPVDLNETVGNLLKMLGRLLGEHITMEFHPASHPNWIEADVGMIEQVLVNLCVNARDAMPRGGRLSIATQRMEVGAEPPRAQAEARPGTYVCLSVQDTGCGMSEAMLKRLFEPFFTTKAEGKGTGLGLATVYGIVKQHHGWVEVASVLKQGSTFRVCLPAFAMTLPVAETTAGASAPAGGKETILLVEDESVVRGTVKLCLKQNGYAILEAQHGEEALAVWKKHQAAIRLLFTDMVMPGGMSGLELAEKLVREKPALSVIIGSGYNELMVRQGIPARPGFQFLSKPYEPEQMLEAIRKGLDTH
jgi:PAS domain S-box-containing protein